MNSIAQQQEGGCRQRVPALPRCRIRKLGRLQTTPRSHRGAALLRHRVAAAAGTFSRTPLLIFPCKGCPLEPHRRHSGRGCGQGTEMGMVRMETVHGEFRGKVGTLPTDLRGDRDTLCTDNQGDVPNSSKRGSRQQSHLKAPRSEP